MAALATSKSLCFGHRHPIELFAHTILKVLFEKFISKVEVKLDSKDFQSYLFFSILVNRLHFMNYIHLNALKFILIVLLDILIDTVQFNQLTYFLVRKLDE